MTKPIVEMCKHNLWANLRIVEACARLGDTQLQQRVDGTYGSIADTLVHLLAAEERYVTQVTALGAPRTTLHESKPFPGIATRGVYGRPYVMSVAAPLLQGINHATEHRSQIATALTQIGIEPPPIDGWVFSTQTALLRWTDGR